LCDFSNQEDSFFSPLKQPNLDTPDCDQLHGSFWSLYDLINFREQCWRDLAIISSLWNDFVTFILPLHVSTEAELTSVNEILLIVYYEV